MSGETLEAAERSRARYHHGDLRAALIDAATRIIETKRVEAFSVADAARAAGVSSGAPYRHFADRDELLDQVAAAGFERLSAATEAASSAHPQGSIDAIIAGGCAYMEFGASQPELFHLMWGATRPHADRGAAKETGARCYRGFLETLRGVMAANGLGHLDVEDFAAPLWAMVHGFAALQVGKCAMEADRETICGQIARATRAYFAGSLAAERG